MWKFCVPLVVLLANLSEQTDTKPLKVTILYEALCPHTASFFADQLAPNLNTVKSVIDLELVPYGKAKHGYANNTWFFECQHGERECWLNMFHACGLKYAISQSEKVKFVNCMLKESRNVIATNPRIQKVEDLKSLQKCSNEAGLPYKKVDICQNSTEGPKLLSSYGDRTRRFTSIIDNFKIPTIIFKETWNPQLNSRAQKEFLAVVNELCSYQQMAQYCYYCNPDQSYYNSYSQYTYGGYENYYQNLNPFIYQRK